MRTHGRMNGWMDVFADICLLNVSILNINFVSELSTFNVIIIIILRFAQVF